MRSGAPRGAVPALAGAAFVYVTAESLPVGLLGGMAHGLHVAPSTVGLLVTVYAAVAGVAALPVTARMGRHDRRSVMVGAAALLGVSQLAMAVAPDYGAVLGARVVAALAHGVFWSMLAPVAARLGPPERAGRATATVYAGNSLALVLGIPVGTALGQAVGWRGAMAAMGVAALISASVLRRTLPGLPPTGARQDLRGVPPLLRRGPLLVVCGVTLLLVVGHFTAYTFITELVRRDVDVHGIGLSLLLLVYGAAGIVGIAAVGRVVDRRPRPATAGCVGAVSLALIGVATIARGSLAATVAAVALWGAGFTAAPVCLQSAVLRVAGDVADTASALYVVGFQIGIGGGALLGSALVSAGHLTALPWIGFALAASGTGLVLGGGTAFRSGVGPRAGADPRAAVPAQPGASSPSSQRLESAPPR